MVKEDFVRVGWLGRTRGVQGDIWVTPDTDFPERFRDLKEIFLKGRTGWEKYHVVRSDIIGGRPVLRFEDITSPEEARRLTNRELGVPRDEVYELPEGSHYIFELIDCDVVGEDDTRIGKLIDIEQYPANDMYVIEIDNGARRYLPVVEAFVKSIDTNARRIVIDPAGLFDATASKPDAGNEV